MRAFVIGLTVFQAAAALTFAAYGDWANAKLAGCFVVVNWAALQLLRLRKAKR